MSDRRSLERTERLERMLERTRKLTIPGIRLPYAQRVLNPFPLASSGSNRAGDFPQSTTMVVLTFNVTVYVATTNSGIAYWTIALTNSAGTTLASVTTSAISPDTWTRLTTSSITQPSASNALLSVIPTATGSPGAIYVVPELIVA